MFRFSLETLLRHREDVEQRARDELSRLSYERQLELNNRDSLECKRQTTLNELMLKRTENAEHQEQTWYYLYLDRLSSEIGESEQRISKLESEIQTQKEVVIEASRKKKILATMKAKKEKEYALAVDRQEQKDVDELVVTRFANKTP